ncbi:MAG: S9 family peptidase [Prevotellaceae bacterium]|jgi:dipeptidyl aminopeptidase/acylaminoacyl peptidase|nr:S9 family peptidase [Prevotellaceae bacterium]
MKTLVTALIIALLCACDGGGDGQKISTMIEKKEIKLASRLMTPEVLWSFGRLGNTTVSPNGKHVAFTVTRYNVEQNKSNSEIYICRVDGSEMKQLTHSPERENALQWSPDGKYIGFVRGGKMFEINPDGNWERQVAIPDNRQVNEFSYSPDGTKILLIIDVQLGKVLGKDVYADLPKAEAFITDDLMYRHWDSWKDGSFSHLHVAAYADGKINEMKDIMPNETWDAPMKPFDDVSETDWSPDGKLLAYSCKKMTGREYAESTNSDIYIYNTETGKTENLTEGMLGYDKTPRFSPDGATLMWLSMERAGFEADKQRIFTCNLNSKIKIDRSKNFDSSPSSIAWAKDGKSALLTACFDETFRVFRLSFDQTSPEGVFRQISTDGFYDYQQIQEGDGCLIASRTQLIRPAEIYRIDEKTGEGKEISFINKEILEQLDLPEMEFHWVETSDKRQMPMWVILPPKLDKTKPAPCIMMCSGGPQGEVSQSYSYRWNYALMASQGYVVIYPARRGVSGYGQEWCDAVSKDHGGQPERDLLSAADYIAQQPFVDKNRMSAVGASYGGYSVFWLAGNHNKRFKAFIAHCGIFWMEAMYYTTEEMFFENWETGGSFLDKNNTYAEKVYAQSPIKFIDRWDTPILIMHGKNDFRVPYTQGMAAFNAARMNGVPARLVVLPEAGHWVLRPQDAILWQREFFGWLDRYVKKQ